MRAEPPRTASHDVSNDGTDQSRIWAHFQGEGAGYFALAHPRLEALARRIERLLHSPAPRILNIGWGDGHLERLLRQSGRSVHVLDPDSEAMARATKEGIVAHVGVIERMPFPDNHFDVVV